MVHITLLQTQKVGSNWYSSFDTVNLPPKTLQIIIRKLPETEKAAKSLLLLAIESGDYKRNNGTLYFVPPLTIGGLKFTHIVPNTLKKNELDEYLCLVKLQTPHNAYVIRRLEAVIESKVALEQQQIQKRELEYKQYQESAFWQQRLPFKKRKICL